MPYKSDAILIIQLKHTLICKSDRHQLNYLQTILVCIYIIYTHTYTYIFIHIYYLYTYYILYCMYTYIFIMYVYTHIHIIHTHIYTHKNVTNFNPKRKKGTGLFRILFTLGFSVFFTFSTLSICIGLITRKKFKNYL